MTVQNSDGRDQYVATAGQTVFPYTFEIVSKDDITVVQNDTILAEGTNYSLTGVGSDTGGNITLAVGATAGDIITTYRSMALERTTDYQNSGDFLAAEVNDDFDRLWLALQQGQEVGSRAIVKPVVDAESINMVLPEASLRLNSYLGFDSTGAVTVTAAGDPSSPDTIVRQQFTGDGVKTVFTLFFDTGNFSTAMQLYVDGVHQTVNTYTTSGTTLTFTEAPPVDSDIEAVFVKVTNIGETTARLVSFDPTGTGVTATNVQDAIDQLSYVGLTRQQFTGDGATTVFTLAEDPGANSGALNVYIDGFYQEGSTFSTVGTALTFSEAPPLNSAIETVLYQMGVLGTTTSNLVTYIPAGAGAVATSVQEKLRETVSVKDFGAVGDGVTNDTAAIQAAINAAAQQGAQLIIGAGHFIYSNLYCYYDVTLNPGYPTDAPSRSSIIVGAGNMVRQDWKLGNYKGTILESNIATGNAFNVGNAANTSTGVQLSGMSFIGATTGRLLNIASTGAFASVKNLFVGNNNVAGTAMYVANSYASSYKNIEIIGNKNFVNGTPVYATLSYGLVYDGGGGGNVLWENVTAAFFDHPMVMGQDYNVANLISKNHELVNCQAQYSERGLEIKHGITHSKIEGYWGEHNVLFDLSFTDSCNNIQVELGNWSSTNTVGMIGNVVVGSNTGTAAIDKVTSIHFDKSRFGHVAVAGMRKYDSAIDVKVSTCTFKNNGGYAFLVDATEAAELELVGNNYYPDDGGSDFIDARRVSDGVNSASHRCFKIDYKSAANIIADLDMSTWRRLPSELYVNTLSGSITLTLPTAQTSVELQSIYAVKIRSNNSLILDAGTGRTIVSGGVAAQTATLTAIGAVRIAPCRATVNWTAN